MKSNDKVEKIARIIGIIIGIVLLFFIFTGRIDLAAILNWIVTVVGTYLLWGFGIAIGLIILITMFPKILVVIIGVVILIIALVIVGLLL